jgi:ABC-type nitrate/sulfonate/bicarbonate transport system permease component
MQLRRRLIITGIQVLTVGVFLLIWQMIVVFRVVPLIFIASPVQVFNSFANVLSQEGVLHNLFLGVEVTMVSFGAVLAIGILLGLVIGSYKSLRNGTNPYLITLSALPRSMFLPLFLLLFGFGLRYQFWFAFLSGIVPILINTIYGTQHVDLKLVRVARSMGASGAQVIRKIVLPSVVPSMLTGARISFGLTYGAVILSEELVGSSGIGILASTYAELFRPIELYSVVVFAALFGIAMYLVLLWIEKRFTRWNVRAT